MTFLRCPRCNIRGFERFSMYGICHDCNYFEVKKNRRVPEIRIKKRKDNYKPPHPFRSGDTMSPQDQFTEEDHRIVRKALLSIPEREQRVVFLFFWKDEKRQEIAEKLGMTAEHVENVLASAYERLRALCLKHPRFSRVIRVIGAAA